MNQKLEALKELSIQFSVELVKKRLSEDVIDSLLEKNNQSRDAEILFKDVETKEDLKSLRSFLESAKAVIGSGLYSECKEELSEIRDDLKWSATTEGKQIVLLEAWVIQARSRLAENQKFKTIFIGRSFVDPLKLVVSGILENELEITWLKETIALLNPPVEPKYIIEENTPEK